MKRQQRDRAAGLVTHVAILRLNRIWITLVRWLQRRGHIGALPYLTSARIDAVDLDVEFASAGRAESLGRVLRLIRDDRMSKAIAAEPEASVQQVFDRVRNASPTSTEMDLVEALYPGAVSLARYAPSVDPCTANPLELKLGIRGISSQELESIAEALVALEATRISAKLVVDGVLRRHAWPGCAA